MKARVAELVEVYSSHCYLWPPPASSGNPSEVHQSTQPGTREPSTDTALQCESLAICAPGRMKLGRLCWGAATPIATATSG
jgi:hypothetical protein